MDKITNQVQWLIDFYGQDFKKPAPEGVEKIKLSQMVSKLGFVYEKFRNAIDYNEEHQVRRNSLERFFKRQMLFLHENDATKISQALIHEFIRAKYLPNDELPETIIAEVAVVIQKYLAVIKYIEGSDLIDKKKKIQWFLGVASCEIDEIFFPNEKELAMTQFMYSKMIEDMNFVKTDIDEKEKNLQIYIATLKNLNKADLATLHYRLLLLYLPNWKNIGTKELDNFLEKMGMIIAKIDTNLNHPLSFQLAQNLRTQTVFFVILKEVLNKASNPQELFSDPELLKQKIKEVCAFNYNRIHSKLIGSIVRVIIYILLTKTVLAFILELPYDYWILGKVNWLTLGINVVFHPFLMFLVAITIKVPGNKNTDIIISEINKIVYGRDREVLFKQKKGLKRGSVGYIIFNTIYLITFGISFGLVIYLLNLLDFNLLSGLLFIFFLSLVSFLGFRLRALAKQLSVMPRKDNFSNLIVDFFSLPIIRVGRFFSSNFSKVNIFIYILDFIIETPFKFLVEFLEHAVSFLREKRDEISE